MLTPLDLVPFDGVEHDGEIAWPPGGDVVMNTAGYTDALASALVVEIAPRFAVPVVSMPAMAILKILAWNDLPEREKHAADVLLIMRHYHEAGQFDRLYDDAADLLAAADYDIELAGSALLGRDARRDVAAAPCFQVIAVLGNACNIDNFIAQAKRASAIRTARAASLVDAFLAALRRPHP